MSKILFFEDQAVGFGFLQRTLQPVQPRADVVAHAMYRGLVGHRRSILAATQILLVVVSNLFALWLRFDGSPTSAASQACIVGLPVVVLVRGLFLHRLRLFGGLWRYAGTWDLRNLVTASALASLVLVLGLPLIAPAYPHSVILIDGIVGVFLLGGLRLFGRACRETGSRRGARRVLIFGAGDAGAMVAREMRQNPGHGMLPVGFVDDDPSKWGCYINGVRVFGSRAILASAVRRAQPHEILIAIPRLPSESLRPLMAELTGLDLPVRILPPFEVMLDRRGPLVSNARPVAIEDLLRREPVALDPTVIGTLIRGRRVLITGAGGSIGSELCRQVAAFEPASLLMLDRYENGLYAIDQALLRDAPKVKRTTLIADVTDCQRIQRIFASYQPEIVFHAAAHKHVPLMELNPSEAVKNNVTGTRVVAEAAVDCGASRFILVSTDKAVNPSSVMGATKRVAELITQTLSHRSTSTVFAAVRFGNVLGSNGSVIPLFMQQIESGGPVTVTHPDIRRFFMLIPEAVQLVLHAASMARQGETYILDMGEQLKVADVALDLIRLYGQQRSTDREIRIEYVGLRPGEKLYEELVGADELVELSDQERIHRVRPLAERKDAVVGALVSRLEAAARTNNDEMCADLIKRLVPTFRGPAASLGTAQAQQPERDESQQVLPVSQAPHAA